MMKHYDLVIVGGYYLVTAAFQVENQKGADILFIFQNQNFALHCNILLYF